MTPGQPLPWQQGVWASLTSQIDLDRLPHALLLSGPAGIGKKHLALSLAQRLLCATPLAGKACGQCRQCLLMAAGSHPDFLLVEPEEAGKVIKIDEIRALADFAVKTASQGGWRVMVICPAEAMNINAANAFLKTLEEPGRQVSILLVSHQASAVLPTLRSRCRIVPLAEPPRASARDWLRGQAPPDGEVEAALDQAGGRPLLALRFLDPEVRKQLRRFEGALGALEDGTLSALDAARELQDLPGRDLVGWLQHRVYRRLRDAELVASPRAWRFFRFLDRLTLVRQRLFGTANPNPQLLWEEVLMDWRSVLDFDRRHSTQIDGRQ
ncbi:MAG: DNA polymerase III subunit delta' [Porticoccaceae bacterium]|nr:DNA polymerase III subunit delta' [Porticoccaceae bacterium]HLS98958.1 DNA polymerase III subunit delta' [Porticoccaceae bacterium]